MPSTICGNNTICSDSLLVGHTSNKLSVDLTTLSGWDPLSAGEHSITVKAKAEGYRDSEASEAVTVIKEATAITNILLGDNVLKDLYIGDTKIEKIYVGTVVVWDKTFTPPAGPWEYPVQTGDELLITQAYKSTLSGSRLWVDFNFYTIATQGEGGEVTGAGTYREGTPVTISATPDSGYEFDSFSIGSQTITENPYTFLPTSSMTVVANFTEIRKTYSLQLSGVSSYSWSKTSSPANPDETLYDGVYIPSNKGVNSSNAAMRIDFSGYDKFVVYIRSYAESNYDYMVASQLDASSYPTSDSGAKANTKGNQQSGTTIGSYTKVEYQTDGGEHHIYLTYRKDSSQHSNSDLGYVLIEK